jgi:hypothetical protein
VYYLEGTNRTKSKGWVGQELPCTNPEELVSEVLQHVRAVINTVKLKTQGEHLPSQCVLCHMLFSCSFLTSCYRATIELGYFTKPLKAAVWRAEKYNFSVRGLFEDARQNHAMYNMKPPESCMEIHAFVRQLSTDDEVGVSSRL